MHNHAKKNTCPPVLRLLSAERWESEAGADTNILSESYELLAISQGAGSARVDGSEQRIARGTILLATPGTTVSLRDGAMPLLGYRLAYEVERDDAGLFGRTRLYECETFSRIEETLSLLAASAADRDQERNALDAFDEHIRFQSLLSGLLRSSREEAEEPRSDRDAIARAIAYIRRAYAEEIEIGRLAEEAGMSRWRFGHLFKTLTGHTPMSYLTDVRIERAKRLLAGSANRIGDVAGSVGFKDEYYFSRRFRKTTGMSPTQFARSSSAEPRICSIQYLGELLALGITPIGANNAVLGAFPEAARDVKGIRDDLDDVQLMSLNPDLIVYPSFLPTAVTNRLKQVAATVEIDWEADVYSRMRGMGRLFGKEREAEAWIAAYLTKAERTRRKLRGTIGQEETASAFVFHAGELYVYGGHHFGHTLYEGIGFKPSSGIQSLIDADRNTKWLPIPVDSIGQYAGDRVFFAVPERGKDAEEGRKLLNHPAWRDLSAVRQGRGYVVSDVWASYNPVTLDKHLDEIVQWLRA
ncbi:helix-turn-helix domain-containing protein [Cohnella sp. GCM10027633]|uniref:helix-turn-helix domain-containing protein n=1 Tax=unclassified Cohnella TaxID=2636738 RepID=UPI00362AB59B